MAFGTASIAGYMSSMQVATMDYLFGTQTYNEDTELADLPPIYRIAGGSCLFGRYNRKVTAADTQTTYPTGAIPKYEQDAAGNDIHLYETYACAYAGSPLPLYRWAKTHDHLETKKFLARHANHFIEFTHWNLEKWGQPPGEYNRHEPHGARNRTGQPGDKRGDTDIERHFDPFGQFQVLCDSELKALGGWGSDDVVAIADSILDYYIKKSSNIGATSGGNLHTREYHRMGNRLNGLAGIIDAYKTYGPYEKYERALELSASLVNLLYQDGWSLEYTGNVATQTFKIWNYGDFIDNDSDKPAFLFTHYRYGSQPWYDGHQCMGLYNLGVRFRVATSGTETTVTDTVVIGGDTLSEDVEWNSSLIYEYASSTTNLTGTTGLYRIAFNKCVEYIDKTTEWYDPRTAKFCPEGDFSSHGSADFINSKLHGFKTADSTYTIWNTQTTRVDLWVDGSAWNDLDEGDPYHRWFVLDIHESDGQYWSALEMDTNGKVYERVHYPRRFMQYDTAGNIKAAYDTNASPYYDVRTEVSNAYGVPDMLWMRGVIYNDDDMKDMARIAWFDYAAHAHRPSTIQIDKDTRLDADGGWTEASSHLFGFSRLWHWVCNSGVLISANDIT